MDLVILRVGPNAVRLGQGDCQFAGTDAYDKLAGKRLDHCVFGQLGTGANLAHFGLWQLRGSGVILTDLLGPATTAICSARMVKATPLPFP